MARITVKSDKAGRIVTDYWGGSVVCLRPVELHFNNDHGVLFSLPFVLHGNTNRQKSLTNTVFRDRRKNSEINQHLLGAEEGTFTCLAYGAL